MKSIHTNLAILMVSVFMLSFQTGGKKVPKADVKALDGKIVNSSTFDNEGKPYIINFWATWCSPCKRELNTIADLYPDWVDETGVKLIAVSIDDARNAHKVKPYVDSKAWEYEVYIDENQDLMRAMNVNNPPHTVLVNGNGEIVYEHNGYSPGDEEELFDKVKALLEE